MDYLNIILLKNYPGGFLIGRYFIFSTPLGGLAIFSDFSLVFQND
jgi:hypothetical protein